MTDMHRHAWRCKVRSSMRHIAEFALRLSVAACALGCRETDATDLSARDSGLADQADDTLVHAADGPGDASSHPVDAPAVDRACDVPEVPDSAAEQEDLPDVRGPQRPPCVEGTRQACASPGNPLVGACHAGVRVCEGGVFGPCSEVLPAAQEICNGIDDNCNGMTDEGCAAGCLVVCASCAGTSDAAPADGSLERPFATLEAAIAAAGRGSTDGGQRRRICVAGGASCDDAWAYRSAAPIAIPDGLVVQGSYAVTPSGLVYCDSPVRPRTTLEFSSSQGVQFDARVATGAELGGFLVEVTGVSAGEPGDATAAIAVTGAKNVSLGRIFVGEGMGGTRTYGVRVTAGGQATIVGSSINAGQGRASAIGVYVDGGTVNLRHNCDDLVAGNCTSKCGDCGPQLGIRGNLVANLADAPAQSSAIYVAGDPGSSVVGSMICGGTVGAAAGGSPARAAAVVCEGPGCDTLSGNAISGGSADDCVGLALLGADPRVDGNQIEGGCGSQSTVGAWLEGSSARLENNRILGGRCLGTGTGTPSFQALHVKAVGASDSPDVHSNVLEPLGLALQCESVGVLLERSSGSSAGPSGLFRNNILSAGACGDRTAVREAAGAAVRVLASNDLYDPAAEPSYGTSVLYHHGNGDATTVAQVNAQPGASGNISADPGYAAYPFDFHLTAGSACIDQGVADGAPASDADRNQRPVGAGYDLGAYEFLE
jgi:hypothetical protein